MLLQGFKLVNVQKKRLNVQKKRLNVQKKRFKCPKKTVLSTTYYPIKKQLDNNHKVWIIEPYFTSFFNENG